MSVERWFVSTSYIVADQRVEHQDWDDMFTFCEAGSYTPLDGKA